MMHALQEPGHGAVFGLQLATHSLGELSLMVARLPSAQAHHLSAVG